MICYDSKTMQICDIFEPTVVALGTFDGAHLGHISVFSACRALARELGAKSAVYTFSSSPKDFLCSQSSRSIFTIDEKIRAIRSLGIDYICIEDFENVSSMSGDDFLRSVLVDKMRAVGACCGFNYKFGKGASCSADDLRAFFEKAGGCVRICDKIPFENGTLSSSALRKKIEAGNVEDIISVSRPYSIYAKVEHGKELGRTIGIPTINQLFPDGKVVPTDGVYITECEIGEDAYPSITNVGTRPTVEGDATRNIETHIIGYDGYLYGSYVRVNFYKKIRDEKKFSSLEELRAEIEKNIKSAIEYFK